MPRVRLFFYTRQHPKSLSNYNDTLRKQLNLDFTLEVSPEKQVTFSVETPKVYQLINGAPIVHGATDFSAQLVVLKALFMKKINSLRENINNTGENNLYQEHKIKNYYLEQQNSFLKHELSLKRNTIDKLLEISSSQCKDSNYSKVRGKKTIDVAKKKNTGREFKNSDFPSAACSLIEQQCISYCEIAASDADSVEKFRISKTHEILETRKRMCQHRF